MAIDLTKMRNKLDKLEGKGRSQSVFWKPQDGDQTVRILPMPDGDPFREMWFHYNLGENRGFLSPKKNFGEDDPLDSFVRKLFNEGTEDSMKMAKNLMARQRFFSPVIVRGEEDKGVRLWGYGKMAYKELVTLALNPDYDDITDPESGTDLVINYGKPPGASFPKTSITPRRRSSRSRRRRSATCTRTGYHPALAPHRPWPRVSNQDATPGAVPSVAVHVSQGRAKDSQARKGEEGGEEVEV